MQWFPMWGVGPLRSRRATGEGLQSYFYIYLCHNGEIVLIYFRKCSVF